MSFDPFHSLPTAPPPQDEEQIVGGLERALEQARTKIPDHDGSVTLGFPSRHDAVKALSPEVPGPVPFDSRAVMDVLRGAIDRYTNGDGHKQGAWVEELAKAKDKANDSPMFDEQPHLAAGYAPDRRRLAAIVVVLFLLVGGIGYTQFGLGGGSENVKTNTPVTVPGHAVTTQTIPSTTLSTTTLPPETTTEAAPVGTVEATTTTVRHTTTTSPPATTAPPETTTAPPDTTTTEPPTTTTAPSTTVTTTSVDCTLKPKPQACP